MFFFLAEFVYQVKNLRMHFFGIRKSNYTVRSNYFLSQSCLQVDVLKSNGIFFLSPIPGVDYFGICRLSS